MSARGPTASLREAEKLTYMRRALELAAVNVGKTGDNPSVGCVIVKRGVIVGEGVTSEGGAHHAEEMALMRALELARGADVYVTLEPCARRTAGGASCAELLAMAKVALVVAATGDPHPNVAGAGFDRLREDDVVVEVGLLEAEARAINADFFAKWDAR